MPDVLLDFPWNLDAALDAYSPMLGVLRDFNTLVTRHARMLVPVAFVAVEETARLWRQIGERRGSKAAFQHLRIFLEHCARYEGGLCTATPIPGPRDLRHPWRCALRDAATDSDDWRDPQIVVPRIRTQEWPDAEEVEIQFDPCDNHEALPPRQRVLVVLESYESHRFAVSDFDPWDLHRHAPAHQAYPCLLPKPPGLQSLALTELAIHLGPIRDWEIDRRYCFIPPKTWTPEQVSQADWRQGRGFPQKKCPHCGKAGPVDFKGEVWCWDEIEGHWDVQIAGPDYWSISHDGRFLKAKRKGS
jgi:hypothetical protein